jgi:tRNA-uridine 2-sulfurtransferase
VWEVSLRSWAAGRTPNPDILCNREVKFKALFGLVRDQLGANYLATGHYARRLPLAQARTHHSVFDCLPSESDADAHEVCLLSGVDARKDQSYFLSQISQEALRHTLFPLGALRKPVVRQIAEQAALHTAQRRDSFGICFVGERKISPFLCTFCGCVSRPFIASAISRRSCARLWLCIPFCPFGVLSLSLEL